jgi:hypothetical protein
MKRTIAFAPRHCILTIAAIFALLAAGCVSTHRARSVETSGFLGDYSNLREGEGEEALLVYVNAPPKPTTPGAPYLWELLRKMG